MPSWSGVGNMRPVSTTTIVPPYSTTVMFLPISPRPPSGRTRRVPLMWSHRAQEPVVLEHGADLRLLLLVGLHEREAEAAHVVPQHVEGGLERDRVRAEPHQCLDHVGDLGVD